MAEQLGQNKPSKRQRLHEIFTIIRKYDIHRGFTPQKFRKMLEELGPTFVKVGQILSMRSELLPEAYCQELMKLRSDVYPMPYELVCKTLQQEYGHKLDEIFSEIDEKPLGSASIAQVHRARLVSGEEVAIKVQRPGVQETMAQDIDIIRHVVRHLSVFIKGEQMVDLRDVVEELWQTFREETNFLTEAHNLQEFGENNQNCVYVKVPKAYPKLCTEHIVVMEYVKGIVISDTAQLVEQGYDLQEIGTKLVDNYAQQVLDDGFFHADPHPGNILIAGGKIVFLDLGMMGRLSSRNKEILRSMMLAVATHDIAALKDGLLQFNIADNAQDIDHTQLLDDVDMIVKTYGSCDLEDLDLGAFLAHIVTMARRNGIELPGTLTMIARGLVTLEGVVDEFLPGTSIIKIISQHVAAHEDVKDVLKKEIVDFGEEGRSALHGALKAASQANLAMEMLTRGQLKFNMDFAGSEDPVEDLSHIADRLTLGVIIAGLLIGSSIVYFAHIQPIVWGVPLFGFLGYVLALVISLLLVHDIFKRNKHKKR